MKTLILIAVLIASLGFTTMAQSIERFAITSGAGEATSTFGENVQFTIGQSYMTNTLTQNGSNYITQGFQQPSTFNYVTKDVTEFADNTLNKINTYPNPAVDYTNVAISLIDNDGVSISIIDMWGQPLKSSEYNVTQGEQVLKFKFGYVPAGVYSLKVVANKKVYTKKLLIAGTESTSSL